MVFSPSLTPISVLKLDQLKMSCANVFSLRFVMSLTKWSLNFISRRTVQYSFIKIKLQEVQYGTLYSGFACVVCWCVVSLILSFQLVSGNTEPLVQISYTSEVTNGRKMDPCLTALNFAKRNLASIASSQSFKKLYAVPLCFIVSHKHQERLSHCSWLTWTLP